jgi:transposase-like protein
MAHRNARTTVYARWLMVQRHLAGWAQARIAEQLGVSRATVSKWIGRYRAEGEAGLEDRSSRPHTTPIRTDPAVEAQILALREQERRGAVYLAGELGLVASTVGRVLARHQVPHLAAIDPITGEPVRRRHSGIRYEHPRPGDLLHVDVKKLGRAPDGGGWRLHGRKEEVRGRGIGYDYLHVAVDDHSRVAYIEALPDERDATCAGFLHRAVTWFRDHGVRARGPMARPSGSIAPCCPSSPTPARGCPTTTGSPPWTAGWTATTLDAPTPPSAADPRPPDSPRDRQQRPGSGHLEHLNCAERGPEGLERRAGRGEHLRPGVALELLGTGGADVVGVLDLPGQQCPDPRALVVDREDLELVERGRAGPVGFVARVQRRAAGGEGDEPERPGADRAGEVGGALGQDLGAVGAEGQREQLVGAPSTISSSRCDTARLAVKSTAANSDAAVAVVAGSATRRNV